MNFLDMMKQKALQGWQALQGSRNASQEWQQKMAQLPAVLQQQQAQITPQQAPNGLPSLAGALPSVVQQGRQALQSLPSAGSINSNAAAMKDQLMKSQMMQHLMQLFGGQNAR